jgi:ABC-type bacteriocin/lantibiotic exporter with double-glycine peptidase domain
MVLAYLGHKITQAKLMSLLGTTDAGTPFSRLRLLSQLGAIVGVQTNGTLSDLQVSLPAIVGLQTGWLHGAVDDSQHAVVVIAIEAHTVWILDPAQDANPSSLTEDEFLAAWTEMDCIFATVSL